MAKQKLLVIKLGGAVITFKYHPSPKARVNVIKRLAKEIKKIVDTGKYKIILVHGAGYVHSLVKKYNLQYGIKTNRQKLVFALVNSNLQQLNSIIIQYLLGAKIRAVSIPPHTFITQYNGKLTGVDTKVIKEYLDKGFLPVLFANMVLDDKWNCSVLSGDTTTCYLANQLKAERVIFLSDVDGIYDSDPRKNPNAKLLPKITNKNFKQVSKGLTPTGRDDISGEMRGKILEIKKYLSGIPVIITGGQNPKALVHAANGDPIGTKLLFN